MRYFAHTRSVVGEDFEGTSVPTKDLQQALRDAQRISEMLEEGTRIQEHYSRAAKTIESVLRRRTADLWATVAVVAMVSIATVVVVLRRPRR